MTECSMAGCPREAHESHTRTIWKVTPDDVTDRPVCSYHYYVDRFMRDHGWVVIVPVWLLVLWLSTFFSMGSGIVAILKMFGLFFISLIAVAIGFFFVMMGIELAHAWYYGDAPLLAIKTNVNTTNHELTDEHTCVVCERRGSCDGEWRRYQKGVAVFGVVLWPLSDNVNRYCEECAARN